MTYLKYAGLLLAMAAGLSFSSATVAQTPVNWLPTGADEWNEDANWEDVGFGSLVPEAQFDDIARIGSGGTAQVTDTPPNIGAIDIVNGTVDVAAGGNLTSAPEDDGDATGDVSVSAGGTLNVAGGGSLSVAGNLNLGGVYSVELTNQAQQPVSVAGGASLGGAFVANFNGAAVTPTSTWDVIDAASVTGSFASVATSGATLPLGQVFGLQQVAGGTNGNLVRLGIEQRLVLNVNRETGAASIENVGTSPVELAFDSYAVESANGSLNPANWQSFEDQGLEDQDNPWFETGDGGTANALAELNPWTSATLAPGTTRELGSIYAPNFADVPFGQETDDHTFTYASDGQTQQGVINYLGDKQYHNIVLTVDPATGEATMQNESASAISFDSYTIASEAGGLLTAWDSLEDQAAAGGEWFESNPSANRLSEATTQGATVLNQDEGYHLSTLFNTGSAQDLSFQFLVAGTATVLDGVVVYGDLPTNVITPGDFNQADFNQDGLVNGVDLAAWEGGFGITEAALKSDGDFDNDQDVDGNDFLGWQRNLSGASGGVASASAVPEPASLFLLIVGSAGLAGRCRKRQ